MNAIPTMSPAQTVTAMPPDQPEPLLRVEGLTVEARLRDGQLSAVLRDLNFDLARGQALGLVGESGAGKSMLGRTLARQLPNGFRVAHGRLGFQSQDLLTLPASAHRALLGRRIAFIPQEPITALNPVRSIGDQLAEHLLRLGVPAAECAERAAAALAEVRLPRPQALLQQYPFELSGGMCQRVMIAMAFASNPDLVISDEATTALDVSTQAHVVGLLRQMQSRRGTSVLFVTHDMGLATHACDQVAVLYAGDIVERGPAKQVFSLPAHPYTRALQQAIPELSGERQALAALPGQMPGVSQFATLTGCRFQPRCAQATESCAQTPPPLHALSPLRWVRCLHTDAVGHARPRPPAQPPGRAMSLQPILELKGLSKTYRRSGGWLRAPVETPALLPMDLSLAPGEFVGIVGESGSGKSTLARLVMGLEAPSTGEVWLNGQPLRADRHEWERRIASIQMIFQDARSALNPVRRVGALLTQAMERRPHLHSDRQARAKALATDVGLAPDTLLRHPAQLSGGQRQRVNIGRALCDLPQVLVADEIVSGLDVSIQAQILHLLLELRQSQKIALLLISHDLGVVRHLCSRIVVMHRGQVVESGDTEAVLAHPQHPYTRALVAAAPPTDPEARWPDTLSPTLPPATP